MVDVIRELGHLNKLAKEDPNKRFDRLYRLLYQEEFLIHAKRSIANNQGARTPGVDGQTIDDITRCQFAAESAPGIRGNTAPVIFGNAAPP